LEMPPVDRINFDSETANASLEERLAMPAAVKSKPASTAAPSACSWNKAAHSRLDMSER
jgi:hypothetical protein